MDKTMVYYKAKNIAQVLHSVHGKIQEDGSFHHFSKVQ